MGGQDISWREFQIHEEGEEFEEGTDAASQLFAEEDPYRTYEFQRPNLPRTILLRGQAEHISTGLALWLGSEVLSSYLVEQPHLIGGKRVMELGAGLGLCGIVAHHLGASQVLSTDGDEKVLSNLRCNVEHNSRNACNSTNGEQGKPRISCPQLIWGRGLDNFAKVHGKADVILASDVGYMAKSLDPLWQTIDRLLETNGMFIYAGRCASQVSVDVVLEIATRYGFIWTTTPEDVYLFERNKKNSACCC